MGYRVPMIIASPWSRGGWVNSQVFDHTSPLQFLERFISHKTRSNIKETNITAWRRAVCGDLTSAFRPYKGEVITKPEFVQKKPFIKSIHQAQYKDVPKGFKALNQAEIDQIEQDPRTSPYFPKQEKGNRDSCGLPYELYVDGYFDQENAAYKISFESANHVFGTASAGAAFTVYSETSYHNEQGRSWNYATVAGDRLQDSWSLEAFEKPAYKLSVYGPNGFFRRFAGGKENPKIKISCRYERDKKGKGFTGRLLVEIANHEDRQVEVWLHDNSYGQPERNIKVRAGSTSVAEVDLSKQHFWYDIKVSCTGYLNYFEQFAGRIEVGQNAKSDPLMA
ncbi:phospholipase domain-containing protein [Sphingobacterium sp. IITKGP-BTPF85]|uniref:phospholipase domain-containing protein n=1 Tax=Sphingobacterium sp. IITKGP-BTPF85 TaxID=1338009 RepID=UPI000417CB93|nr:phospholipase domain-containing protein [Sphingobacterium sp. IITKGP-BTPF85]